MTWELGRAPQFMGWPSNRSTCASLQLRATAVLERAPKRRPLPPRWPAQRLQLRCSCAAPSQGFAPGPEAAAMSGAPGELDAMSLPDSEPSLPPSPAPSDDDLPASLPSGGPSAPHANGRRPQQLDLPRQSSESDDDISLPGSPPPASEQDRVPGAASQQSAAAGRIARAASSPRLPKAPPPRPRAPESPKPAMVSTPPSRPTLPPPPARRADTGADSGLTGRRPALLSPPSGSEEPAPVASAGIADPQERMRLAMAAAQRQRLPSRKLSSEGWSSDEDAAPPPVTAPAQPSRAAAPAALPTLPPASPGQVSPPPPELTGPEADALSPPPSLPPAAASADPAPPITGHADMPAAAPAPAPQPAAPAALTPSALAPASAAPPANAPLPAANAAAQAAPATASPSAGVEPASAPQAASGAPQAASGSSAPASPARASVWRADSVSRAGGAGPGESPAQQSVRVAAAARRWIQTVRPSGPKVASLAQRFSPRMGSGLDGSMREDSGSGGSDSDGSDSDGEDAFEAARAARATAAAFRGGVAPPAPLATVAAVPAPSRHTLPADLPTEPSSPPPLAPPSLALPSGPPALSVAGPAGTPAGLPPPPTTPAPSPSTGTAVDQSGPWSGGLGGAVSPAEARLEAMAARAEAAAAVIQAAAAALSPVLAARAQRGPPASGVAADEGGSMPGPAAADDTPPGQTSDPVSGAGEPAPSAGRDGSVGLGAAGGSTDGAEPAANAAVDESSDVGSAGGADRAPHAGEKEDEEEKPPTPADGDGVALLALGRRLREAQSALALAMTSSPRAQGLPAGFRSGTDAAEGEAAEEGDAHDTAGAEHSAEAGVANGQASSAAVTAVSGAADGGLPGGAVPAAVSSDSNQLEAVTRQRDVLMAALAKLLTVQAARQPARLQPAGAGPATPEADMPAEPDRVTHDGSREGAARGGGGRVRVAGSNGSGHVSSHAAGVSQGRQTPSEHRHAAPRQASGHRRPAASPSTLRGAARSATRTGPGRATASSQRLTGLGSMTASARARAAATAEARAKREAEAAKRLPARNKASPTPRRAAASPGLGPPGASRAARPSPSPSTSRGRAGRGRSGPSSAPRQTVRRGLAAGGAERASEAPRTGPEQPRRPREHDAAPGVARRRGDAQGRLGAPAGREGRALWAAALAQASEDDGPSLRRPATPELASRVMSFEAVDASPPGALLSPPSQPAASPEGRDRTSASGRPYQLDAGPSSSPMPAPPAYPRPGNAVRISRPRPAGPPASQPLPPPSRSPLPLSANGRSGEPFGLASDLLDQPPPARQQRAGTGYAAGHRKRAQRRDQLERPPPQVSVVSVPVGGGAWADVRVRLPAAVDGEEGAASAAREAALAHGLPLEAVPALRAALAERSRREGTGKA